MNEPVHRCPPKGEGAMPCCGRAPFEVPRTDRMTVDEALVTCAGRGLRPIETMTPRGRAVAADVRQQLTEALDEVERIALSAIEHGGDSRSPSTGVWTSEPDGLYVGEVQDTGSGIVVYDESRPTAQQAAHIARWDPATVLRLVKRGRSLIADFDEVADVNLAWVKVEILHAEMVRAAAFWLGTPERPS